jgi:apolipoprotein N-acyltransferase
MKMPNNVRHNGLLVLSGAIFPLGLAPFGFWPITIISISLLFYKLINQSTRKAFLNSFFYGFGLFLSGASWIYISIHEYGFVAAPVALTVTIIFCLLFGAIFALPFFLVGYLPKTQWALIVGCPSLWVLSEWLRSWVLTGFPWLYAGYSHTDTWLSGWAPLGGVLLLSYFCALLSILLVLFCQGLSRVQYARLLSSLTAALFLGGYLLQSINWTQATDDSLSVALIQPNIPQNEKWSTNKRVSIMQQLAEQTEPLWDHDIIVWPEAAIPIMPERIPRYMESLKLRAKEHNTTLLAGAITFNPEKLNYYYNSLLAVSGRAEQYNKTRLVPFGEYVPFESYIRGLIKFFDLPMSKITKGSRDQKPFLIRGQYVSAVICYEVVYPDLVARNSASSSLIVTVSNDTWFGRSLGPVQHMQMVRMRAIENAKPIVRATNNGMTGVIDFQGHLQASLDRGVKSTLSGTVQPRTGYTPFSIFGSWPIIIFSIFSCLSLVILRFKLKP